MQGGDESGVICDRRIAAANGESLQNGSDYIRGSAQAKHFGDKVGCARLRWFGHEQRIDGRSIKKGML